MRHIEGMASGGPVRGARERTHVASRGVGVTVGSGAAGQAPGRTAKRHTINGHGRDRRGMECLATGIRLCSDIDPLIVGFRVGTAGTRHDLGSEVAGRAPGRTPAVQTIPWDRRTPGALEQRQLPRMEYPVAAAIR